jgi:hypothetical protein
MPAQAKGASKTHQTQAAAPISLFMRVMQTLLHLGHRIFMGYFDVLASDGYLPLSLVG